MEVYVGCCGIPGGLEKYSKILDCVEIQQTFYKLPKLQTAQKWRKIVPKNFIFCVKAFRGITHPTNSPTWRRYGEPEGRKENYGNLQPTKEVFKFWEKTLEFAKTLGARIVLIQTPASFRDEEKNLKNAEKFFSRARKAKIQIAFEPRKWKGENVLKICKKFELVHCTDPFASKPLYFTKQKIAYLRLHGSPPGKKMYAYKYTDKDLKELANFIKNLKVKETFVFFNNVFMQNDALRFKKYLES